MWITENGRVVALFCGIGAVCAVIAGYWNTASDGVCRTINSQDAQLGQAASCAAGPAPGYWVAAAILAALAVLLFAIAPSRQQRNHQAVGNLAGRGRRHTHSARQLKERGEMNTSTRAMPGGWRLRDHPVAIAIAGLALAALSAIAYFVPDIFFKISVSDARGVCNSGLGLLAQGMDKQAQSVCGTANTWSALLEIAGVVGLVLAAVGGFLALQRNQRQPRPVYQPQPQPVRQQQPQPTYTPNQAPPTTPLRAFMEARQYGEQDRPQSPR